MISIIIYIKTKKNLSTYEFCSLETFSCARALYYARLNFLNKPREFLNYLTAYKNCLWHLFE